ncbi:MAG TPA: hypothetical protein VFO01_06575 [Trebonia sp.]|nr:hypothetical protein [Trebonia sp.]
MSLTDTSLAAICDITKHLFDVSLDLAGLSGEDDSDVFDRTQSRSNSRIIELAFDGGGGSGDEDSKEADGGQE